MYIYIYMLVWTGLQHLKDCEESYVAVGEHLFDKFNNKESVWKGIQGHQSSCFVDSTLFALFALSDSFDQVFLMKDRKQLRAIEEDKKNVNSIDFLWKRIVNPLRKLVFYGSNNFNFYLWSCMHVQAWCSSLWTSQIFESSFESEWNWKWTM